ncbi:cell wall-binding repeat-containing protein, partial [Clostridium sp. A1-XYC3]
MKSKRILCALAFAAVISQGVLLSTTQVQASSVNTVSTHRLAGESRYETSIAISQGGWDKADTVIITSGEKFADALCAGPLAQEYDAPILLTPSSYISENTINELARLQAKNIILVGGTASISTNVEDKLKAVGYTNIDRIGGKDRYETSIMIAEKLDKTDKVVIASGENFPDALSISAVASKLGMPILLSPTSNLSEYAKEFIENNNIKETYIIGGEGVLSALIEKEVPSPVRLGGDNRYGTNLAVIKYFEKDLNFDNVYLTLGEGPTGDEFADALSGAALAGNKSAPILMTNGSIDNGINTFVKSKLNLNTKAIALGGQAVVPDTLIKTIMDEKTVVPVVKTYDKAGTYSGGEISGSVTISASDVYLKNTTIKGDLLIASTVNDGNIDLDNVIVTGKTIINGGGANSVHYHNGNAGNIHLDKPIGEETRVIIDENASIDSILVESNGILDETNATKPGNVTIQQNSTLKLIGKFDNVEVKGQGANVTAENATIGALRVTDSAKNSSINIGKNSSVQTISAKSDVAIAGEGQIGKVSIESASINVKVQATNVSSLEVTKDAKGSMINIDENAKVNTLTLNAAADIKGKGEIKNASVNAEGTTLEQKPSNLNIGKGISSTVGGNKETGTAASGGSSGGGNSGGGSSHSELAIISVAAISDINVPNGTEASAIGLPSAVQVTLSNNSTVNANVT